MTAFIDLLEELLNYKLKSFLGEQLNGNTIVEIHHFVTDAVFELFAKCNFDLSELSKKYVVQELFKCLTLNNSQDHMQLVVASAIKESEIPLGELRFLCNLLVGADFHDKLADELHNRI
jgi:hypothetical protein